MSLQVADSINGAQDLADLLKDGVLIDGDWVESKDQDPNGDVRLIQLADVGDGYFRNRSSRFLTMAKAKELRCTFLELGDILVARMPDPLGRACIFPGVGQPAVTAVDVCILRPNPARARVDWLVKAINSPDFREAMQQFVRGTTRQRISRRNLGALTINVPPLQEQARLSQLIDSLELKRSSGASHIAAARRGIERFRQAILAAACSGRLTSDWRDAHEDACTVEQSLTGLPSKKSGRHSDDDLGDLPLPDLPDSYVVSTVGGASLVLQYGTSKRSDSDNTGVPVLRMGNIQDGELELDDLKYTPMDREIERLILKDGDVLFNRTNSPELVGKSAVFHGTTQMTFASYLIRVRFAPEVAEPDFVNFWINSAWGKAWARQVKTDGVSQSNINGTKLGAMPVPLPPIDEQKEIVRRASRMLELADGLLARIELASRRVDQTSHAVLAKAFRGDLLPTGADLRSVS